MENKLLNAAEGILDSAVEEYLESNLENIENVKCYADACNISLTDEEAEKILNVCRNWVEFKKENEVSDSIEYYTRIIERLEDE